METQRQSGGEMSIGRDPGGDDDRIFAEVAYRLREIQREIGWKRVFAIGEIVLSALFEGEMRLWRQRARRESSLRRLASRPECPLKKTQLARSVSVYVAAIREPRILELTHITPSHVGVVLSVPGGQRLHALQKADSEQIGARELRLRVARQFEKTVVRREHPTLRRLRRIRSCVLDIVQQVRLGTGLSEEQALALQSRLHRLQSLVKAAHEALQLQSIEPNRADRFSTNHQLQPPTIGA